METDILTHAFLVRSIIAGLILGFLSPLVGIFLVVRRFSLLADTLAHVSLLGVALSMLWRLPITLGALLVAVIGGWGIEMLRQSRRIFSEASLAIFLSGSLALALILFSLQKVNGEEIEGYLFGSLASVSPTDLSLLIGIACVLVGFFILNYRKLFLIAIDEELARVSGIRTNFLNALFMFMASGVVAIAIKIVGVLLVSALIVIPVLAAMQWRLSFRQTLCVSLVISEISVVTGFFVAYIGGLPSGPTIALGALVCFIFSYLIHFPKNGLGRLF